MIEPAAAAVNPAVAQANPKTFGTDTPIDMEANWSSDTARIEIPTVDFLKNQEKEPISKIVMITPISWVQEIETSPIMIGSGGKNSGKEKFSDPNGVK